MFCSDRRRREITKHDTSAGIAPNKVDERPHRIPDSRCIERRSSRCRGVLDLHRLQGVLRYEGVILRHLQEYPVILRDINPREGGDRNLIGIPP